MIQLMSNVKIITSGNVPTTDNLLPGQAAFGKLTSDGKYHLFGNTGEGGGAGKVVDIVLDTFSAQEVAKLQSVMESGNDTTIDMLFKASKGGATTVTIAASTGNITTTGTVEAGAFTDHGKTVLSANPSLVVSEADAGVMRGFLNVYSKAEVDAKLASALHMKGSVAYKDLPTQESGVQVGDVYNIKAITGSPVDVHGNPIKVGDNVVWVAADTTVEPNTPAGWDVLAGVVDLSNYYTKGQVDSAISTATSDKVTAEQVATQVEGILTNGHYVSDENYVHTDENYTAADKAKVGVIITDGDGKKVLKNDGTYDTLELAVTSI